MREFLDYFSGGLNEVALGKGELFRDDVAFPADATSLFTRLDHTPIAATPASAVRHTPVALILSNVVAGPSSTSHLFSLALMTCWSI